MPHPHPFFTAAPKGRRIVAGFTYAQRIGRSAATRAWLREAIDENGIEWAAVREFDLLQESGNIVIDVMEVTDINKSMNVLQRMRAGGYRVTMITLGRYDAPGDVDDLQILDLKLQEEITRMIHFLYLGEKSEQESFRRNEELKQGMWSCADALPHVMQALGERRLFKPHKQTREEQTLFELLEILPARHIVHDVAVGLALPDATKENVETYIARGEHKIAAFMNAIAATMGTFISHQPRGYGDRLTPQHKAWSRQAVTALNAA